MATTLIDPSLRTAKWLRDFAGTLSKKDRPRLAVIEATHRGHGGITYIAGVFGVFTRTIEGSFDELDYREADPVAERVRRSGAGSKKDWY